MKNQVLFLILYLIGNSAISQNTYSLLISNPMNEIPGGIVELSNQSIILSSVFWIDSPDHTVQKFFKINPHGLITHDTIIENPNGTASLSSLVFNGDTSIFCIGDWNNLNEKDQKWVIGIDTEFNIHWDKKYQTNFDYVKTAAAFRNSQNKIISTATATDSNDWDHSYLVFQEFSLMGDLLKSTTDSAGITPTVNDMIEFPSSNMYRAAVVFYSQYYSSGQVLMIDSSLTVVGIDSIPFWVSLYNSMKRNNESSYYLSGNTHINGGYDYALMLLDTNNDCKKITILDQHDTVGYAGIIKSMDFINRNNIFLAGTSNFDLFYGRYGQQNSWYELSRFDSALNIRWTKYYGGDAYYVLQSVTATYDGGVLLAGTRYDYPTQSHQCDIFLIKVDENGLLTSNDHKQQPTVYDGIVYPNPGKDYLTIESGPQIFGAKFMLNSIDGKQVITKSLTNRKMTLNTQKLSSGIYIWNILFNDKVVETGKWIKK
jgi:hypothetical protein